METFGRTLVNIREDLPNSPLPVILGPHREYSLFAARDFIFQNPGKNLNILQISNLVGIYTTGKSDHPWILTQTVFPDRDIEWYLHKKGIKNKQLIPLIDGNPELVRSAQLAYPHMEYFISSLHTGMRMKKAVPQVQPCILVAVYNTRIVELELPPEAIDYVVSKTPLYGRWLEQHVDKFYEILRKYK